MTVLFVYVINMMIRYGRARSWLTMFFVGVLFLLGVRVCVCMT